MSVAGSARIGKRVGKQLHGPRAALGRLVRAVMFDPLVRSNQEINEIYECLLERAPYKDQPSEVAQEIAKRCLCVEIDREKNLVSNGETVDGSYILLSGELVLTEAAVSPQERASVLVNNKRGSLTQQQVEEKFGEQNFRV